MTVSRLAPFAAVLLTLPLAAQQAPIVFGYKDFSAQAKIDAQFLAVPDAALAGQHLKELTKAPHWASSKEDYDTVLYVEKQFKAAGLKTEIVPFRVLLNKPVKIVIEAFDSKGNKLMSGPTPEHVDSTDPEVNRFQNDPRVLTAFNGGSPSGDVTAPAVYVNYGSPADFKQLADLGIDVKDKIAVVRYGGNYRGIKAYDAQRAGCVGVIIYSDPIDDGYTKGDAYPNGPWRPASAVQRGAVQFLSIYPGDATTPGIASTPDLPDSKRIPANHIEANWPSIPVNPLSYKDAEPILRALTGPDTPRAWQGALPFTYHTGGGTGAQVSVHMNLQQDTQLRTIWDVIGTIEGSDPAEKDEWVVAGNHRDGWVYGAVDPNSGTAAMLETAHGLGALLQSGWRPKRTIVLGSWDAEEEGLIGSTEWVEGHGPQLRKAAAYFNMDVGVSGPNFNASSVPSLKQFVREVTRSVPSPSGGTVYDQWLKTQSRRGGNSEEDGSGATPGARPGRRNSNPDEVRVGDLGSGSDYTPFFQHEAVPSTDIGSGGPYGVYHSVFDNYDWFVKNADPTFVFEQQQARVFGLELLHMADADVLPYSYASYGTDVVNYVDEASRRAGTQKLSLDFSVLKTAAARFAVAGKSIEAQQLGFKVDPVVLNRALRSAEEALLDPNGLPKRPWFRHTVFAPGEFTGYAAVVIPGVNEGIDASDQARTQTQIGTLAQALDRASTILETAAR